MVNYTMTPGDVESGVEERTQGTVEEKPTRRWTWRVLGGLLLVALCVATAMLFAWQWHGKGVAMMQDYPETISDKLTATKDPHLKQIGSNAKAAIHLEGEYNSEVISSAEWKNDVGQAFSQGGFELKENQIIIPHTGLYFVYSQASFRVKCNDVKENLWKRIAPLSHIIWRHSDSFMGNSYLLSAVRSVCQRAVDLNAKTSEGWYNAVYLGGVFRLMKGDRLWTETKRLADLESEEGKTFFGVFAL